MGPVFGGALDHLARGRRVEKRSKQDVEAEDPGVVSEILVQEGQSVSEGDTLVVLD